LKIAIAYQRAIGQGTRTRLIGRERGYNGVGFGGISVGGIVNNRRQFGTLLTGVDHLPHTHNLEHNAFTMGRPEWGAHLADNLEAIVALHGAETIAAVIVEPMAGSTGVLVPPIGYLEKLREITRKHGIVLIFDECTSGFRETFGGLHLKFGVEPDLAMFGKALGNGYAITAILGRKEVMEAAQSSFISSTFWTERIGPSAALKTLEVMERDKSWDKVTNIGRKIRERLHKLSHKYQLKISFTGFRSYGKIEIGMIIISLTF
jgi:beta-alanine--pyruvate transaminase